MKYLKITLLVFLCFFSVDIKEKKSSEEKKKKKKSSENDQSTGHFQSFFIYFFSSPPTLGLKKKSRKSTNKKIWPYQCCIFIIALGREHSQHRDVIIALGREHYQHSDVIMLFILLILTSDSPPLSTTSGNHNSKSREIYHHWGLSHDLLISSVTNTSSATSRPTHLLSCQPRVTVMQCFVLRIACSSYCLTLTSDSPPPVQHI